MQGAEKCTKSSGSRPKSVYSQAMRYMHMFGSNGQNIKWPEHQINPPAVPEACSSVSFDGNRIGAFVSMVRGGAKMTLAILSLAGWYGLAVLRASANYSALQAIHKRRADSCLMSFDKNQQVLHPLAQRKCGSQYTPQRLK